MTQEKKEREFRLDSFASGTRRHLQKNGRMLTLGKGGVGFLELQKSGKVTWNDYRDVKTK